MRTQEVSSCWPGCFLPIGRRGICLALLVLLLALAGCQRDPFSRTYTTVEPKPEDMVGTYVLDALHLPPVARGGQPEVVVELRADGTFTAKNVPPWRVDPLDARFLASLVSGEGQWQKSPVGTRGPEGAEIWGVYLQTPDNRLHPAKLTGSKPPYGLIFTLGDPDSGHAVVLSRRQ